MSDVIDLKTFVSQTLIQIVKGVNEAAKELGSSNDIVSPQLRDNTGLLPNGFFLTGKLGGHAQLIDFDVAITATDSKSKGGGAGISVVAARIGMSGQSAEEQQSVSRVKFKVPLTLPKYSGRTFKVMADME